MEIHMNMSFEEKSTWASLVIILFVFTGYFSQVYDGFAADNLDKAEITGLFFGAVITVIVLEIVLYIAIAIFNVKDADSPQDERARLFSMKAGNISGWVLGIGVLIIAARTFADDLNSLWVANLLLFMVFISQIVSYGLKLFYYRRGY
jgi:hypothetical protein